MGRDLKHVEVSATLSNHNSEQDDIDLALWADFKQRIQEIVDDDKYAPICPMVF